MKNITDDDLTLLYYGEHDDPALAATVARSPGLTARFEALSAELSRIDEFVPPRRDDDYGSEVWRRISPQLAAGPDRPPKRWTARWAVLGQPRFSLAGALSLVLVAALAFMLGRQGGSPVDSNPAAVASAPASVRAGLDAGRLLTSTVSGHLEQLNLVFTEFANSAEISDANAGEIMDMLVANRLYRQAAIARDDHQLAAFLSGLEPVLIELAHEAYKGSPATRARMQEEIRDKLLFRIRVMNMQLENPDIST
jgi:hypothetical protein